MKTLLSYLLMILSVTAANNQMENEPIILNFITTIDLRLTSSQSLSMQLLSSYELCLSSLLIAEWLIRFTFKNTFNDGTEDFICELCKLKGSARHRPPKKKNQTNFFARENLHNSFAEHNNKVNKVEEEQPRRKLSP